MNADIVYKLCPHLDLGSLFALAAAYPVWSPLVRKYMEKKKLDVVVLLECHEKVETFEYLEPLTNVFGVLPKCVWKEVPSCVLDIRILSITQKGWSAISEDTYAVLTKITTSRLDLTFCRRSEARRVLQTISFRPHSHLSLGEQSIAPDKEPILVQSEVAHFKRIDYSGYADMLHNDLLEALDTEIAILRYAGVVRSVQALWFTGFIEGYSAAKRKEVRCVRRKAGEYVIERVLEGDATRSTARRREITVSSCPSSMVQFSRHIEDSPSSFVVENFLE